MSSTGDPQLPPMGNRSEGSPSPSAGNARRIRYEGRTAPVPDTLRGIYERYCEREAMALLQLIPSGGLRQFYRQAAAWAEERGEERPRDPLGLVRRYAREILPLPPYDRWVPLYLANRSAYLEALEVAAAPRREDPVAVAVRPLGDGWHAALCLSSNGTGWRGFIQFHRSEGIQSCRTAEVFRGEDPVEIRARFDSFDDPTLTAFLRSVLP